MKKIWFDMDGTISDLYGVEDWLSYLESADPYPYAAAKPMLNFSLLARYLNKLQSAGWSIGIISWTSKSGTDIYNGEVMLAKLIWLHQHLKSVQWNEIKIVKYGTNKYNECGGGILFDDEERNRNEWKDKSYTPDNIINILKELLKGE